MDRESIFESDELDADKLGADDALPEGEAQTENADGPARDEQGRFKAKEPEGDDGASDEDAGEADDGKGGTVPQGALHAEREKRKSIQAELDAAKAQLDQFRQLREQIAARKPADLPAADDPSAMEHLRTRLAELEQGQTRVTQQMDAAALDHAEAAQLSSVMAQSEAAIRQSKPDYDAAIEHVVQARAQELALYGLDPVSIQRTISEEAAEIVRTAVQRGMDPAELGYQIAMSRGYRPQQAEAQTNGGTAQQQGGAAATLEAVRKAQAATKSLGSGGGAGAKTLNAEAIAGMTDDEFDALYSTPEGRALIDGL